MRKGSDAPIWTTPVSAEDCPVPLPEDAGVIFTVGYTAENAGAQRLNNGYNSEDPVSRTVSEGSVAGNEIETVELAVETDVTVLVETDVETTVFVETDVDTTVLVETDVETTVLVWV